MDRSTKAACAAVAATFAVVYGPALLPTIAFGAIGWAVIERYRGQIARDRAAALERDLEELANSRRPPKAPA